MTISIQKANFWKRFSAWLVDTVLVILLAVACSLPLLDVFKFDANGAQIVAVQEQYQTTIEEQYSVDLDITQEEYDKLPEAQKEKIDAAKTALNELLMADKEFIRLRADRLSILLTAAAIAVFLAILLAHFVLPLILKNGQTLGKKTFGLAVVKENCVKIGAPVLFTRSMIGLCGMETMAVAFLATIYPVGLIAAGLVLILQIFVMIKTSTNAAIHDLLAHTVVVDFSSQRIFETEEEYTDFVAKASAEDASIQNEA
jgi:uncharacterized RDD family membrane protein YckC